MRELIERLTEGNVFGKVSSFALYALAVLIPLWVLPVTQNITEYQKQALLVVLVFLGLIAWLAKTIQDGEFRYRLSWVHAAAGLVLLASGVSSAFSEWRYASFWGFPLDVSEAFVTLLFFVLLYALVSNTIENLEKLARFLAALVGSVAVASLVAVLQLKGVFLPFAFAQNISFNTIGSPNSVALLAAALLPLSLMLASVASRATKAVLWAFTLVLLAAVVLINFQTAWLVLIAGLLVLLAFGMVNVRKGVGFSWVSSPMALLVIALFFVIFGVSVPGAPVTPLEVSPSQAGEVEIARQALSEKPVLGSGPGTFSLQYAEHRSAALNQTIFWGTRFASGASEVLDVATTQGGAGAASLLILLVATFVFAVRYLVSVITQETEVTGGQYASWISELGVAASLFALTVALFLYPFNFVTWFVFWVLLGALVFAMAKPKKASVAPPSLLAPAFSFVFLLTVIFGLGLLFVGGQKYAAELQFVKAARAANQGDLQGAITRTLSAARMNPSMDLYWQNLAQLYLAEANAVAADQSLSDEERSAQSQTAVSNTVAASRQAVAAAPANVANWNVQGFVYRSLIGIQGAQDAAIQSYQRAAELEPASPFPRTELGRVYVLAAQRLQTQGGQGQAVEDALDKAVGELNAAIELKADYAPAHFLLATVHDVRGNTEEAIAKLEETTRIAPNDAGLALQLGLILRQEGRLTRAAEELERAKRLNAGNANVRYALGLVYDEQGETEKALAEFRAVAATNPSNEEVGRIIENIEAGDPALEGITPALPPVEETPPEIQEAPEG